MEAVELRQGWSVAKNKGDVRKKKSRRPRKWSVSARRGREKVQEKKETRRREGGSAKENFHVSSTKNFLFLVNKYLGFERPISFEYRLLRDFVYKEALCEESSGNGLPYAARAVP